MGQIKNGNLFWIDCLFWGVIGVFLFSSPSQAATEFCLQNKVSKAIQTRCKEVKSQHAYQAQYWCYSEEKEEYVLFLPKKPQFWIRVEQGKPVCLEIVAAQGQVPRGNDSSSDSSHDASGDQP